MALKRRIGLMQRADTVPGRDERRDALDQRWAPWFESLGVLPLPVPNGLVEPVEWALDLGLRGLLLSGGNAVLPPDAPDKAPERDRTESALLAWAHASQRPLLGICRGFQAMNVFLGGHLTRCSGHVGQVHPVQCAPGTAPAWAAVAGPSMAVNSFHQWAVPADGLAKTLRPLWLDQMGLVEAAVHAMLPWWGVMWHPERGGPSATFDHALIQHFIDAL